jgi:hypothetical protein
LRGRRGGRAWATARCCAVPARSGWPLTLRADSRLTVLGARPNTLAIVRNESPWANSRLSVSRIFETHVHIAVRSHGNTVAHPQGRKCCTWS